MLRFYCLLWESGGQRKLGGFCIGPSWGKETGVGLGLRSFPFPLPAPQWAHISLLSISTGPGDVPQGRLGINYMDSLFLFPPLWGTGVSEPGLGAEPEGWMTSLG